MRKARNDATLSIRKVVELQVKPYIAAISIDIREQRWMSLDRLGIVEIYRLLFARRLIIAAHVKVLAFCMLALG